MSSLQNRCSGIGCHVPFPPAATREGSALHAHGTTGLPLRFILAARMSTLPIPTRDDPKLRRLETTSPCARPKFQPVQNLQPVPTKPHFVPPANLLLAISPTGQHHT